MSKRGSRTKKRKLLVKYAFRNGSGFLGGKRKAAQVAFELNHIKGRSGGILPKDVVRTAKRKTSPLHELFEWDDSKAARAHRLQTARRLIAAVEICYVDSAAPKEERVVIETRAFQNLKGYGFAKGEPYYPIVDVLSSKDKRLRLLHNALSEARNWQERYTHLEELAPVFKSIAAASRRLTPKRRKAVAKAN